VPQFLDHSPDRFRKIDLEFPLEESREYRFRVAAEEAVLLSE
jgi:hypothetical protein